MDKKLNDWNNGYKMKNVNIPRYKKHKKVFFLSHKQYSKIEVKYNKVNNKMWYIVGWLLLPFILHLLESFIIFPIIYLFVCAYQYRQWISYIVLLYVSLYIVWSMIVIAIILQDVREPPSYR
jgi:hypothetical protein